MHLYLVRHGTTTHNLESRHQHPDSPLAEEGIALIREIAQDLVAFDAQVIYTSHFIRARKTAEIINEILNVPLIVNEKLKEIKRPTIMEGKLHSDAAVIDIKKLIRTNYHMEDWHHSDEENFFDLKKRAWSFLQEMETQEHERILAVSHGIVIKMLAALVIFGADLDSKTFQLFYDNTSISNGGITVCRYKEGTWKLRSLNSKKYSQLT